MISLIQGRPGSGKSYEAVKYHILPAIKDGRKVVTNIPINKDAIKKFYGYDVAELIHVVADYDTSDFNSKADSYTFSKPQDYQYAWVDDTGRRVLFVIDECHFCLPKSGTHDAVKKFYTMHRHQGYDIVLLTQQVAQLDKQILGLIEVVYKCTKATAMGSSSRYIKKVFDGYRGDMVDKQVREYDKTIFPFYKSHTQASGSVLEVNSTDLKPIWKTWPFYMSFLAFALGIYIFAAFDANPLLSEDDISQQESIASDSSNFVSSDSEQQVAKDVSISHPLDDLDLEFEGYVIDSKLIDGSYVPKKIIFFVHRDGDKVKYRFKDKDLRRLGYAVELISETLVRIQYDTYIKILARFLSYKSQSKLSAKTAMKLE